MTSTASFIPYSAAITSFKTVTGKNLALAFDNKNNYEGPSNQFFGASIGRVANRIYGGEIEVEGKKWPLPTEPEGITLHGGAKGWDKLYVDNLNIWQID